MGTSKLNIHDADVNYLAKVAKVFSHPARIAIIKYISCCESGCICNDIVILDYTVLSGAAASIVLRNEWVDQFYIGGRLFRKYEDEGGEERFGQLIYEGEISCIYFWEKEYTPDLQNGQNRYKFFDPVRNASIVTWAESPMDSFTMSLSVKADRTTQSLSVEANRMAG